MLTSFLIKQNFLENYVSFECVLIDWNLLSERSCGRLDLMLVFESARDFYCFRLLINFLFEILSYLFVCKIFKIQILQQ